MKSTALEVNLSDTKVDVVIHSEYQVLIDIVSPYVGILNRMTIFLQELSHPYKNWEFILSEARHFSLQNFHLYKGHARGEKALALFVDIFLKAFEANSRLKIKTGAVDNLMLFLQHIAKNSQDELNRFLPIIEKAVRQIESFEDEDFYFFVKSYYQPDKIAKILVDTLEKEAVIFKPINTLLIKFYNFSFNYWLKQDDPVAWIGHSIDTDLMTPEINRILKEVSHVTVKTWQKDLEAVAKGSDQNFQQTTKKLIGLVGFQEFVSRVRGVPQKIVEASSNDTAGFHLKLTFLFYIINISGMATIHVQALREINSTLIHLIDDKDFKRDINQNA